MTAATIAPESALQARSVGVTVSSMVSRRKMDALAEAGAEMEELEKQIEVVRAKREKRLVAAYQEGWPWEDLAETGHMSLGTVRNTLRRAGALEGHGSRPRTNKVSIARNAAQRASKQ